MGLDDTIKAQCQTAGIVSVNVHTFAVGTLVLSETQLVERERPVEA